MNETKLVSIAEDVNDETGNTPNGSAQIVNRKNDCKYEFTLKMQRRGTDVKGGGMKFTLVGGLGIPNVTHSEASDTLEQDPETKEWVWTFGELKPGGGVGPNRTLEFEADYLGDADKLILSNATYSGKFADDSTFGPSDVQLEGTNKTKGGCEIPTKNPPEVTAVVEASGCSYHFEFTAEWKGSDISGGMLNFTLNNGFADPVNVVPAADLNYNKPNGIWTFGELDTETQTRTLVFDAIYTGAPGQAIFAESITFKANYEGSGDTGNLTVNPTGDTVTVRQCPVANPCCEASCSQEPEVVMFEPCDDVKTKEVEVGVAPKGRKLSVKLNLPEVCPKKAINVGIFVTEVVEGGERPFAHKVIQRPATGTSGTCKDDRDCDCVNFMIYDNIPCASTRTFKIRTEAHYVDEATDFSNDCKCDCQMV